MLDCESSTFPFNRSLDHADPFEPLCRNADIRVIFYRTCELLRRGILAVFVADGKGRPAVKRGKKRGNDGQAWNTKVNKLFNMFRLMGMEVRRAPGEAEAELAAMAKRGEIDAVLSVSFSSSRSVRILSCLPNTILPLQDDVDGFLFGVPFVRFESAFSFSLLLS